MTAIQKYTADSPGIKKVKDRMKALGMPVVEIERETSFALQLINRSKDLLECTPNSILSSIINAANIGLTLNPASKEACLVSRWNGRLKAKECSFEPMYGGLAALAMKEGVVTSIAAQIVYDGDSFEVHPADNKNPICHSFNSFDIDRTKDENIRGFYAIATFSDGTRQVEVMGFNEVCKIRDNADAYIAYKAGKIKKTPWVSNFGEMGRKTVLKRLTKYLNKKGGTESKLLEAISLDNEGYGAKAWQLSSIDDLLRTANLGEKEMNAIYQEFPNYTYQEANECLTYLKENQLPKNPQYNDRYNMTEAGKAVEAAVENPKS